MIVPSSAEASAAWACFWRKTRSISRRCRRVELCRPTVCPDTWLHTSGSCGQKYYFTITILTTINTVTILTTINTITILTTINTITILTSLPSMSVVRLFILSGC